MFRRIDGHMSGHVEMKYVPGVDMSTGSLGQGISARVIDMHTIKPLDTELVLKAAKENVPAWDRQLCAASAS